LNTGRLRRAPMSSSPSRAALWTRWLQLSLVGCFICEVGNVLSTYSSALAESPDAQGFFHHLPGPVRLVVWGLTGALAWLWHSSTRLELARHGLISKDWNLATPSILERLPQPGLMPIGWLSRVWRPSVLGSGCALFVFFSPLGPSIVPSPWNDWIEMVASLVLLAAITTTQLLAEPLRLFLTRGVAPPAEPPAIEPARTQGAPPANAGNGPGVPLPAARPQAVETSAAVPLVCVDCGLGTSAPRCPRCGSSLCAGAYTVAAILGKREYARTYRALRSHGKAVVLKELWLTRVPDVTTLDAFEVEARVLAGLHHPRIPRFVESFTTGEGRDLRFTLAMEEVPGVSLAAVVKQHGVLPVEAVGRVVAQTLELLIYLQRQEPKVVHRDIKPSNLIQRADGAIVLVDFGVARRVEAATEGTLVGTVGYMPPEQLAGRVDTTSDLYALGVTALHLLTGVEPSSLLGPDARLTLPALPVSAPWQRFLRRLIAPDRARRFPDAVAARRAFGKLSSASTLDVRWVAGIAAAAAVMLLGAAMVLRRGGNGPAIPPPHTAPSVPVALEPRLPDQGPVVDAALVVATYPGGEVMLAEAIAEASRLPPALVARDSGFMKDLVIGVAMLEQLDRLAVQQHREGATARQRVAALIRAEQPPVLREFLEERTVAPEVLEATLGRIVPRPALWTEEPPAHEARKAVGSLGVIGGEYELAVYPGGTVIFDELDGQSLMFRDWLMIEMAAGNGDLFTTGSYAPYSPPEYRFAASGPNWRIHAPPRPRLNALLARYPTQLAQVTTEGGVTEAAARQAYQRISETLSVCLAATAWDRRWSRVRVRASLVVDGEHLNSSLEVFVEQESPLDFPYVSALLTRAEGCGSTLRRWRFPSNVKGRAVFDLILTGTPWSFEEQDLALQKSPEWFQHHNVNSR
jgi:hypothetical protein